MTWITKAVAKAIIVSKMAFEKRWSFIGIFACIFLVIFFTLGKLDLLPEAKRVTVKPSVALTAKKAVVAPIVIKENPLKIEIPIIGVSATISNPTTTDIQTLDKELLSGAVRYPTSAKLGETGNVVIFAHSSYLPVVGNQAYKAFNGIQKLVVGNTIAVTSTSTVYTYRVRSVTKESTNSAGIPLDVTGRVLTLSTCDSFGAKTDRFVVVADFVESHSISG